MTSVLKRLPDVIGAPNLKQKKATCDAHVVEVSKDFKRSPLAISLTCSKAIQRRDLKKKKLRYKRHFVSLRNIAPSSKNAKSKNRRVPFSCKSCNIETFNCREYIMHVTEKHFEEISERNSGVNPTLSQDHQHQSLNSTKENLPNHTYIGKKKIGSYVSHLTDASSTTSVLKTLNAKDLMDAVTACKQCSNAPDEELASESSNLDSKQDLNNSYEIPLKIQNNLQAINDDKTQKVNEFTHIKRNDKFEEGRSCSDSVIEPIQETCNTQKYCDIDKENPRSSKVCEEDVSKEESIACEELPVEENSNTVKSLSDEPTIFMSSDERITSECDIFTDKSLSKLENIIHNLKNSRDSGVDRSKKNSSIISKVNQSKDTPTPIFSSGVPMNTNISEQNNYQIKVNNDKHVSVSANAMNAVEKAEKELGLRVVSIQSCSGNVNNKLSDNTTYRLPTLEQPSHVQSTRNIFSTSDLHQPSCLPNLLSTNIVSMPNHEILTTINCNPSTWTSLQNSFHKFPYPPIEEISHLSTVTGLSVTQIKTWFVGARLKYGISWSPEEVVDAWSFTTKSHKVGSNSQHSHNLFNTARMCNTSSNNVSHSNCTENLFFAPTQVPPTQHHTICWISCFCGTEHEVNVQQHNILDSASYCNNNLTSEQIYQLHILTNLPCCSIMSFYQGKQHLLFETEAGNNNVQLHPNGYLPNASMIQRRDHELSSVPHSLQNYIPNSSMSTSSSGETSLQNPSNAVQNSKATKKMSRQFNVLYNSFVKCPFLTNEEMQQINQTTGMYSQHIQSFFINKRSFLKKKLMKLPVNQTFLRMYDHPDIWYQNVVQNEAAHKHFLNMCNMCM